LKSETETGNDVTLDGQSKPEVDVSYTVAYSGVYLYGCRCRCGEFTILRWVTKYIILSNFFCETKDDKITIL